jgi:hypothetical protein
LDLTIYLNRQELSLHILPSTWYTGRQHVQSLRKAREMTLVVMWSILLSM